ncbi:hypothetical protein B0O99DRAFT_604840 [Bisporella sp. PMI_857]|nr:hypothetical protein B0O99DRAFT_604840 [Bisporella sp. PMI_857]
MTQVIKYVADNFLSESPVIFMDSDPSMQPSYLGSYVVALRGQIYTALTGDVPKFHEPGKLRVVWWDTNGSQGLRDYELRQYREVETYWNSLRILPEVRRCVVMGYTKQNPYKATKESRELTTWLDAEIERTRKERERMGGFKPVPKGEGELDVDALLDETEKLVREEQLREANARKKVDV